MKLLLQNLNSGKTQLVEGLPPRLRKGHVLVRTHASLISAGTERMLVEFSKAGYLGKARSQPDKVRQVLDKFRTDGILTTIQAVRAKLDQPLPLGYCNMGQIIEVDRSQTTTQDLETGDRVVSNGFHAEVVCVPQNLCVRVPDEVSDEEAAFTVLGAIGLQGVRLAQPTLGETFAVIGLGLIGQLTVQLLIAHGCRVIGIDLDRLKCNLAKQFGAEAVALSSGQDPMEAARDHSRGRGVDGVLITAATKSSDPMHQAAQMCRKRGRIVLVGVTGLELSRADFYDKEISFQVSCSYGPGRYDPFYEEKGHDYPIGFVRWTEQRNFEAVLDMMALGKLDVKPLITHRLPFEEAEKAYQLISQDKEPYSGIILKYGSVENPHVGPISRRWSRTISLKQTYEARHGAQTPVIGLIGAGNFTGQVLLPAVAKTGARLKIIASGGGVSGTHLGRKFGFEQSTTDTDVLFGDSAVNTVLITTQHNSHARFVVEALKNGRHVFVEKPLCLTIEELEEIRTLYAALSCRNHSELKGVSPSASARPFIESADCPPLLMVGFNRRFAPHILKMKTLLENSPEPKSMVITVNAGVIPREHWTQDPEMGGGRIVGEACHFIDLLRFLAGYGIQDHRIFRMKSETGDTASIHLAFKDGSIGTVHYFSNGNKRYPKERLDVFVGGRILQLDNFRTMRGYGWKYFKKMRLSRQDKGHEEEVRLFLDAVKKGSAAPIPVDEVFEVSRVALDLAASS